MAGPFQISTSAFLPDAFGTPGPYEQGGNLFVVLITENVVSSPDPNPFVRVYRSTDSGATWSESDAANKKHYYQSATSSPIDVYRRGTKLYITYVPNGGTPGATALDVAEFDMSASGGVGAWGTVITGGPIPADNKRFKTFKLSDGRLRCVYVDLHPINSRWRINVATYASGAWGSGTALFNPGTSEPRLWDYIPLSIILDDTDNLGILCHDGSGSGVDKTNLAYRWYSAAGSAGNYLRIPCSVLLGGLVSPGPSGNTAIIERSNGDKSLIFPIFSQPPNPSGATTPYRNAGIIAVDHGSDPVSSQHCAVDISTPSVNHSSYPSASAVWIAAQRAMFLYWPVESNYDSGLDDSLGYEIRRSCTKLLSHWPTPTTVVSTAVSQNSRIATVCAALVGSKIGLVFSAASDTGTSMTYRFPHYADEAVPTCSSSGCPTGSGAQFNGAV